MYLSFKFFERCKLSDLIFTSLEEFRLKKKGLTEYLKKLCCNSIINHHHLDAQLIIEKINKNTIIISREQHLFNHESFFVGWVGSFSYFRQVLLVCHKNYWHDLWRKLFYRKLVTFLLLFFEVGQENIHIGPKNYFQSIRMFSYPPSKNKQVTSLHHK